MDAGKLQRMKLFDGMTEGEIQQALRLLEATERRYQKGEVLLMAGSVTDKLGLVLEGSVTIENNDDWGNRTIISHVGPGQVFAESYALTQQEMLVDVTANEDSRIMFLRTGQGTEAWSVKYTLNLLRLSAQKNLHLSARSFHTAPKTIRGRVMAYLHSVSVHAHSRTFTIPFDRQQLADYLNVERSALSKELGKMQWEGLITVRKSRFTIL
ncbi:MAG: Crp/Fnr family transcriptional regulator [Clostridia bacterium]|nr:Crp/Fnr family transcriptional regulator [Clostridia bacterium]